MFGPRREEPASGQESVWDYPRPPRLEPVAARLRVVFNAETIADTVAGFRVLETSHPPVYYIPQADIRMELMRKVSGSSWCEFKGEARYWSIAAGDRASDNAAWSYPSPSPAFAPIAGHLAFYATRIDACFVGDEQVRPQQGDFYGGWITSKVVGPFKGGPGTRGW